MTKFQYIDSVNISVGRKIVNYAFGAANVLRVVKNDKKRTFDIWLMPDADVAQDTVKYFNEFWGKRYKIHRSISEERKPKSQFA